MLRMRGRLSRAAVVALVAFGVLTAAFSAAEGGTGTVLFSGRDVFRGFFFGEGPVAPRLRDLRAAARKLASAPNAGFGTRQEIVAEVERARAVFVQELDGSGGRSGAQAAVEVTEKATPSTGLQEALLAEIEKQEPAFLGRFGQAMQSNEEVQVVAAIRDGSSRLLSALEVLGFGPTAALKTSSSGEDVDVWLALASALPGETLTEPCPPRCCQPKCVSNGSISGLPVEVSNTNPAYGDQVTFTASASDNPGRQQTCVGCEDGPVVSVGGAVQFVWAVTMPNGVVVTGSGSQTWVNIDRCGTWTVEFTAYVERPCPPASVKLAGSVAYDGMVPCPTQEFNTGSLEQRVINASACLAAHGVDVGWMLAEIGRYVNPMGEERLCICCGYPNSPGCGRQVPGGPLGVCVNRTTMTYPTYTDCECSRETTFLHEMLHVWFHNAGHGQICPVMSECFGCGTIEICD
jgi:hypothetical protein